MVSPSGDHFATQNNIGALDRIDSLQWMRLDVSFYFTLTLAT